MLSCKKATSLMDKKAYARLGPVEGLQLILHRSMCDACRRYEKQSRIIDTILHHQQIEPNEGIYPAKSLPDDVKSKIIREL